MVRDTKHPKFNGNQKRDYGTNIYQPINHLMKNKNKVEVNPDKTWRISSFILLWILS